MERGREVYQDLLASGARPADLSEPQATEIRAWLAGDFLAFAVLLGGCDLYAPLHAEPCQLFQRWGTPGWRRIEMLLPRSSFKSTLFSRTGPLWLLARDPNVTIAIVNKKIDRVKRWFAAIQSIVAGSDLFHALYRHMIPPGVRHGDGRSRPKDWRWNAEEMVFVRDKIGLAEASMTAIGVGTASAGGHWDYLILDDLVEVEEAQSQTMMQAVKDWFDTVQYLGPTPETMNAWISATRWTYDDIYRYAQEAHGFRVYKRSALENGTSSFPKRWSTAALLAERERNAFVFNAQMMNEPAAGKETALDPAWVKRVALVRNEFDEECLRWMDFDSSITVVDEPPPQQVRLSELSKILLVDPAPSEEADKRSNRAARTALVLLTRDAWGRYAILDIWAGREEPLAEMRRMLAMMDAWGTDRIGVEEITFSRIYAPMIAYMADRERRKRPRTVRLKPGKRDKGTRIAALGTTMAAGFFGMLDVVRPALMDELLPYPFGRTVDILDACAYHQDDGVLGRPESELERESYSLIGSAIDRGADEVTGYIWPFLIGAWIWQSLYSLVA